MILLSSAEICNNDPKDNGLEFFTNICIKWLKEYSREHVSVLDRRIRFKLQSFFEEDVLLNADNGVNFTIREKESVLEHKLIFMIKLSWRLMNKGIGNSFLSNKLMEIVSTIKQASIKNGNKASVEAVQEFVEGLVMQSYFHSIFTECKLNAYSLLLGLKMIMIRLFRQSKSDSEIMDINMRACGEFGSLIGTHLHIYRLCSASLIACSQAFGWDAILESIKNSTLSHTLSPMINQVSILNLLDYSIFISLLFINKQRTNDIYILFVYIR